MAVRFVIGRSGSGKTHRCVAQLAEALRQSAEGPALILLAPEQGTFQLERLLIETLSGCAGGKPVGYHRARVLSFRRFARLVFNELGGPVDAPIEPLAKQMALRAVLGRMRSQLPTFAASLDRPGFLARLAELFSEFHRYRVTAAALRVRAEREPRARLQHKLRELADAFDAFNAYLAGAKFTDPDAALDLAAERLPASHLARGARVWIDGFAGFTPQELTFVGGLASAADAVEIALIADPADLPAYRSGGRPDSTPGRLFRRTEQTYLRLRRLFDELGVPVESPVRLETIHRFAAAPPLAQIERELFAPAVNSPPRGEGTVRAGTGRPSLLLVEAPDRRSEVRAAATHVCRLVADGLRYRDIAIIVRSLDEYWQYIAEAFADAAIPYFIDRRQPISHHPLVELVRSAVGAVVRRLHPSDVIAFLKTDLAADEHTASDGADRFRDAVDRLENYALQFGLSGPTWLSPQDWKFHQFTALGEEDLADAPPADVARIIAVAQTALAPLAEFYRMASTAGGSLPVRQWTAGLWRMLVALDVESTLARWAESDTPACRPIHRQALDAVVGLLADLTTALGDQAMGADEFAEVLESGLSDLTLGLVPPALDQVLIGAIERSRHPSIRAAVVLGLAERSFPKLHAVRPILTDEERDCLAQPAGASESPPSDPTAIELAPSRCDLLFDEDLMAYLALTRASERVWVSWPAADDAGKPINPSRYFRRLTELFPLTPVTRLTERHPAETALTPSELSGVLAGRLATSPPSTLDALIYETLRLASRPDLVRATRSLGYVNQPALSPELARPLFAPRGWVTGSVTRLEAFAACPFRHLARYGLSLQPRQRIELDALHLGRLYHELLHELYNRLGGETGEPVNWAGTSVEQLRALVAERVAKARESLAIPALAGGATGYLLAQAERALGDLAAVLHDAAAAAPTIRQVAAELSFGLYHDADLPPLRLPLGRSLQLALSGKIDRVDRADSGELFVIDYKTGAASVDWSHLAHGLSLQLPAYLLVLAQHGQKFASSPRPAGAFLQRIVAPPKTTSPPASDAPPPNERDQALAYRREGLFLASAGPLLDATLRPGERSPFIKRAMKKDGEPAAVGNDSVTPEQLDGLLRHTTDWLTRHGQGILAGQAAVEPYRLGQKSPCGWCDFRSVCRLDFAYNRPRWLAPWRRGPLLENVTSGPATTAPGA